MGVKYRDIEAKEGLPLELGFQGENDTRRFLFDVSDWLEALGEGAVQLMVRRPGEALPYPAEISREGTTASWAVADADLAREGCGWVTLLWISG